MHLTASRYPRGTGMKQKLQSIRSVVLGVLVCQQMQDAGMFTPRLNFRSTSSMWDTHTKRPFRAFTLWRKPHFTFTHLVQRTHACMYAHTRARVREAASQSREHAPCP